MNQTTVVLISATIAAVVLLILKPAGYYCEKFSRFYLKELLDECARISYDLPSLHTWLRIWSIAIFFALLTGVVALKPVLGAIVAFMIFIVPKQVLARLLRKRISLLKEQLISSIVLIANTVKTGLALEQAIAVVAKELPAPLGLEFRRVAYECEHGRVFEKVLKGSKERIQIQEYSIFVAALVTNKKRGGDVTDTLEEIKKSLVENRRLERKLEADTSSGRMVINVLAAVPFLFLILSYVMNPDGTNLLFSTLSGQALLAVAAVLVYIGYRWGQKIVKIEF